MGDVDDLSSDVTPGDKNAQLEIDEDAHAVALVPVAAVIVAVGVVVIGVVTVPIAMVIMTKMLVGLQLTEATHDNEGSRNRQNYSVLAELCVFHNALIFRLILGSSETSSVFFIAEGVLAAVKFM